MRIIKDRQIIEDQWVHLPDDTEPPVAADVIVSITRWQAQRSQLIARAGKIGIQLGSNVEPESVVDDLAHFSLIAVEFPKFSDGRGFTTARLLRERFKYQGELRAVGHVLRDQMFYMWRCGFNAFELPPGKDLDDALTAFSDFSVTYQAAVDDPRPLFRRRHAS